MIMHQFEKSNSTDLSQFAYSANLVDAKWPIWMRVICGLSGLGVVGFAMRKSGPTRALISAMGISLISRAILNQDFTSLLGAVIAPVLRLRRTLFIAAPVEEVFDFWKNFGNYPKFMSFIKSVAVNEEGNLTWTALGPAHRILRWRTRILAMIPNQKIIWKSVQDSLITNEGTVEMHASDNGTVLRIDFLYAPPMGALGYGVSHLLGYDPRERFDEDLGRMKQQIEKTSEIADRLVLASTPRS